MSSAYLARITSPFANDVNRKIEEVIKVDQTDEAIVADEIDQYGVTDSIKRQFLEVLEDYQEAPLKPTCGIGVRASGFFGSGKSSYAKVLGQSIANVMVAGITASDRFLARAGDNKISVVLKTINDHIPTHAVIFDVSTDRGIQPGE